MRFGVDVCRCWSRCGFAETAGSCTSARSYRALLEPSGRGGSRPTTEQLLLGRLVLENLVDFLHNTIINLLQDLKSLDVLVDLFRLRSSSDDGRDIRVLQAPSQGKLSGGGTEFLGDLGELTNLLELGFSFLGGETITEFLHDGVIAGKAAVLGDAVVVLSGQDTRREGRPDGGTILVQLEQRHKLLLELVALKEVVLRLVDRGRDEVVFGRDMVSVLDLERGPLGCTPVKSMTIIDDLGERTNDLLHRRKRIGTVRHDNINIIQLQPLQTLLHTLQQMLPTQALVVWSRSTPVQLGRDNVVRPVPSQLLDRGTHCLFAFSVCVDLRSVEVVDPVLPCFGHALRGTVTSHLSSVGDPATEGESRDLQSGRAEETVLHLVCLQFGSHCSISRISRDVWWFGKSGMLPVLICWDPRRRFFGRSSRSLFEAG
ncbi:hypothetical protein G7K_3963-t1 [Saitoella complicata NRRL Y-17804]|uniref:Uncharacterized protein n=1 Tax=Saitoella complicata (strain BCRC 22490 / CBS 7301 / JCM 7358 / NBRC 10748 / NRRL Y-17804) TaxID=698492 RepID=A0A0E9NK98_SAICN|nr:hypothetical protein G7K_3963-t1 [Saitoella complicata NRRL Y-17804]